MRLRATLAVCWGILLPLSTPIFCSPSDIMALIWAPVDFDGCFRRGCRPLLWCLAHSDCVHPRPRLCAPSTQIVYLSTNLHANADWVHPRPRLCAPSTQIVYTLDPDSRLSKAKTAHWLVSNVKSLPQLLNFSPVYSLVKLFHRTLQSSDWQSGSPRSSLEI